jgi:hypothetical protein
MAKKKVEEEKKIEYFREKWTLPKDFPEDKLDLLNERFELTEKWEAERRKQGPPFNEQFNADVYAIAVMMTKDDSFKGKFNPEELYQEMCDTMDEMKKGKKYYSLYEETKMVSKVMDKHRKKTLSK